MNHAKFILNKVFINGNSRNPNNNKCLWTVKRQCRTNYSVKHKDFVYVSTEFIK